MFLIHGALSYVQITLLGKLIWELYKAKDQAVYINRINAFLDDIVAELHHGDVGKPTLGCRHFDIVFFF